MRIFKEERFNFITQRDKQFIELFHVEMEKRGYDFENTIGDGYCQENIC